MQAWSRIGRNLKIRASSDWSLERPRASPFSSSECPVERARLSWRRLATIIIFAFRSLAMVLLTLSPPKKGKSVIDTKSDDWMINKAVHYNAWRNLQATEFAVLASAYRALLKSMQCSNAPCGEFLRVSPPKGSREVLRCGCGQNNLNLTKE